MISFVIFYVDEGLKKAEDHKVMIEQFFKSASVHHPDCKKVVLSDFDTDLSFLDKDVEVNRYKVDKSKIMFSRMTTQIAYLESHDFSINIILLDYDILINANLEPLFQKKFDIGLTYRKDLVFRKMPINGGIIFLKKNSKSKGIWFLEKVYSVYRSKYYSKKDWYGDQYSLIYVVGNSNIPKQGTKIIKKNNASFLLLPCKTYNFSPTSYSSIKNELKDKKILHFKGPGRKELMNLYWNIYFNKSILSRLILLRYIFRENISKKIDKQKIIDEFKEQCELSIKKFENKILPLGYIENGIFLWEGFAFCAMAELFDVDIIIESGIAGGRSTEIWARYFNKPIFAIDDGKVYGVEKFNETKKRLSKYKNIKFILSDSNKEFLKLIKKYPKRKIGIFIDGPKRMGAQKLAKKCFKYKNVKFVSIHDECWKHVKKRYHLMDKWNKTVFYTDADWFINKYDYLENKNDPILKRQLKKHEGEEGGGFAVNV